MSETENNGKEAIARISENSNIRLGLALLILGGAIGIVWQISQVERAVSERAAVVAKALDEKLDLKAKALDDKIDSKAIALAATISSEYVRKDLFLSEIGSLRREMEVHNDAIQVRLAEILKSQEEARKAVHDR